MSEESYDKAVLDATANISDEEVAIAQAAVYVQTDGGGWASNDRLNMIAYEDL